jgi:hypothetical protein
VLDGCGVVAPLLAEQLLAQVQRVGDLARGEIRIPFAQCANEREERVGLGRAVAQSALDGDSLAPPAASATPGPVPATGVR